MAKPIPQGSSDLEKIMAGKRKVGKKHVKNHSKRRGTKIVPEHLMGKTLTKKSGHKRVSRKRA